MKFGDRLKEQRTSLNYSQKELAELIGLTLRTIQRIESNEVNPSLHSIKVIGKALDKDFSKIKLPSETKPYEFNLTIKINDMNQLINDLKTLLKNNWKTIALIVIIIWLVTSYTDIKSGIIDGWNGK
jgi:transcriptional regulator with XRE-family HTH domain